MEISSKSIKKKAQELGFQKLGIAKAEETLQEKEATASAHAQLPVMLLLVLYFSSYFCDFIFRWFVG